MKAFVRLIYLALLLGLISGSLFAQDKSQAYYNTHESEILPDAQAAFQNGNYSRAALLCNWHYIIVGDDAADSLRDMAERCTKLSTEMEDLHTTGKIKEAKDVARTLLSINPNDAAAKKMLEESEEPDLPIPIDTVVTDVPIVADTVVKENPLPIEIPVEEKPQEPVQTIDVNPNPDSVLNASGKSIEPTGNDAPRTKFVLKAGASLLDLKQIAHSVAPGGSLGLYDLGGSPIGGELGAYICPGLSAVSASLFGADAFLVFRAAKNIYPKLGIGFFSCKSTETNASTKGLCAGGGLTYMIGGHFCLEIGVKYYPKVSVQGTEKVLTTPGASYEFPSEIQIISGGIAPFVSVGWAF